MSSALQPSAVDERSRTIWRSCRGSQRSQWARRGATSPCSTSSCRASRAETACRSSAPPRRAGPAAPDRRFTARSRGHTGCNSGGRGHHEASHSQTPGKQADDSRTGHRRSGAGRRRMDPSATDLELPAAVDIGQDRGLIGARLQTRWVVASGLLHFTRARIPLRSGHRAEP
jgi:hypothetical protein